MLSLTSVPLYLITSLAASNTWSNGRSYRPSTRSLTKGTPGVLRPVTVPTHPAPTSTAPKKKKKICFIAVCNHIRSNRQAPIHQAARAETQEGNEGDGERER